MLSTDLKRPGTLWGILLCVGALLPAQPAKPLSPQLNESGQIVVDGRSTPYLIRHLPVSSFPDLPASVADLLNQRGCLIPQTYEAHQPENVIHAGFERAESLDWAVLCSAQGTVSLLVFFSSAPGKPFLLALRLVRQSWTTTLWPIRSSITKPSTAFTQRVPGLCWKCRSNRLLYECDGCPILATFLFLGLGWVQMIPPP